ncbi:MAG: HU family DNA-binding protein [Tannerella sp.]|jgi:nucleoid DNA-binding protein|nr:HU family DNA-binding protein [Tannerella sp.]
MNERIDEQILAQLLAEKTKLDAYHTAKFINILADYIIKGIENNKSVKVSGLGIFKVVIVRERESVHVQTGARIVLPSRHKITFVPDKQFKEQINKPFSYFEPVEAFGDYYKIDEVADADEFENINEDNDERTEIVTQTTEQLETTEDLEETYEKVSEDDEIFNLLKPDDTVEVTSSENDDDTIVIAEEDKDENVSAPQTTNTRLPFSIPIWVWFIVLPLLIIAGVGAGTYAFLHHNSDKNNNITQISGGNNPYTEPYPIGAEPQETITEGYLSSDDEKEVGDDDEADNNDNTVETQPQEAIAEVKTDSINRNGNAIDWLAPSSADTGKQTKRADRPNPEIEQKNKQQDATKETKIPKTIKVTQGMTLRFIAERYYGDKMFWVYIYEENKSKFKDPDILPLGITLTMPLPAKYGIDAKSMSSKDRAIRKQREIYSR